MRENRGGVNIRVQDERNLAPKRNRLWRYGPLVIWAILIFIGSGNVLSGSNTSFVARIVHWLFPGASVETLAFFHLLVRKIGHLGEYAVLAMLAAHALRTSSYELLRRHWFLASLLVSVLYSLSDEFHQSFIPTRGASIYDCLIDSLGGLIGLAIVWLWHQTARRKRGQRAQTIKASAAV